MVSVSLSMAITAILGVILLILGNIVLGIIMLALAAVQLLAMAIRFNPG